MFYSSCTSGNCFLCTKILAANLYLMNIMKPWRRGLEPVNEAEGKAESLFERSEFNEAPEQVLQALSL